MDFAGGREFLLPNGKIVRSANITPDIETGIGNMTREAFIGRFKSMLPEQVRKIEAKERNTIMPWSSYAGMKEEDLGAIYDYLRTVKPIKNQVEKWPK